MKSIINKNQFIALFIALFAVTAFNACSDVAGPDNGSDITAEEYNNTSDARRFVTSTSSSATPCQQQGSFILKASKRSIDAGSVSYKIEGDNIIITFDAKDGWGIAETHLYVSDSLDDLSRSGNGAPIPGHMPYSSNHDPATDKQVFTISLSEANLEAGDTIYIVAHAVVGELKGGSLKKTETAFAGDKTEDGPRWWWYIESAPSSCSNWGEGS